MKIITRIGFWISALVFLISLISLIVLCINDKKQSYCGVVKYKTEEAYTRYKSRQISVNSYLGVQFDNGYYKAVNVDIHTFMTNGVGDRVCFKFLESYFDKSINKEFSNLLLSLFLSLIVVVILGSIIIAKI